MLRSACLVVAAAALLASQARAEVDVTVPATFKAKGSLDGEVDVFRFFAPSGTVLDLKIRALRKALLNLDVRLFDPSDAVVFAQQGFGLQVQDEILPSSGEYRMEVRAVGSGDYSLSVKCKAQRFFISGGMIAADATEVGPFSAFRRSTARFFSAPGDGSPAELELVQVNTPGGVLPLVETVKGTRHSASAGPFEDEGDFEVVVHNVGLDGGAFVFALVKPPKARPGKLDLRRSVLGRPSGGETFVSGVVDDAGGTVEVLDTDSDLFGAAVNVPAGALAGPMSVGIASTVDPRLDDDDDQAAGPAVDLSPSGTVFTFPVTVTLPFDIANVPADATSQDIRILIVEDNGSTSIVAPTSVDDVNGTVSIETTGFSVCIPIINSGPPRLGIDPGGDEYWFLQFGAELQPGAGNDSRARRLDRGMGELSFFSDGTLQYSQERSEFSWSNQDAAPMSTPPILSGLVQSIQPDGATLNWAYTPDGTRILLSGAPEALPTFRVSRDGRYMAGRHDASVEVLAEVQFAVRKETRALDAGDLNGTWNFVLLELDASQSAGSGAAVPKPTRGTGTFTFDGAGTCGISLTQRRLELNDATGATPQVLESGSIAATYAVDDAVVPGTFLVTLPPEGGDPAVTLRVHPGTGLDVMLCVHETAAGNAALGIVMMRQGTTLGPSSISGDYSGAEFSVDPQSYGTGASGVDILDFSTNDQGVVGRFEGTTSALVNFDTHHVQRDTGEANGVLVENLSEGFPINVALTKQGKLTLSAGGGKVQGCAAPGGQVFALVSDIGDPTGSFEIFFLFRAPPLTPP